MNDMKRIAVVGLPNTGKSTVFNEMTGEYTLVANYPLTTVEMAHHRMHHRDLELDMYDTPGLHSLYIHSEEELAVRDFLFNDTPDGVIQCIDVHRLRQSLVLTIDLVELRIPFGIVLTAIDETEQSGLRVDAQKLSALLGVPVHDHRLRAARGTKVPLALIDELKPSTFSLSYGESLESIVTRVETSLTAETRFPRRSATLLAEGDRYLAESLAQSGSALPSAVDSIRSGYRGNLARDIAKRRRAFVDTIVRVVAQEAPRVPSKFAVEFARIARHPILGLPLLGAIIVVTYLLVVEVAGAIEGALSGLIVDPIVSRLESAIASPFFRELLVGDYGLLTLGIFNAFVTVLPILSMFFLVMGVIEDIGYLPNLTVLTRKVLGRIGLSGRSVMSLVLGFGCKTMATLTTRGIASKRERYITIYLIAFAIPCSAQLAIDMAILGRVGFVAFLIAYGMLAAVEIGAGFILNKVLKKEERIDFVQELPPIRLPDPVAILKKTGYRLYWFLKEAVPIFLAASVVLFALEFSGALGATKEVLEPVVTGWLGLPLDTVEVLILSLARHEAAAGMLLRMVDQGALDYIQSIIAVVITTMFVPCFANIVAMCRQIGVAKGLLMTFAINISSFILAGLFRMLLEAIL
jgi:ferrous iron transport protein B